MTLVTIKDAKATLNRLVAHVEKGERVILLRGSKVVASIVPTRAEELDVVPKLSDEQAERLFHQEKRETREGRAWSFPSVEAAVREIPERLAPKRHRRPN